MYIMNIRERGSKTAPFTLSLPGEKLIFERLTNLTTDLYAKDNPDGFLSHYLSLRSLWCRGFIDKLKETGSHLSLSLF